MSQKPRSLRHLDNAIRRMCANQSADYVEIRTMMANAIVATMLPDGVVKGGTAIKMRFGDRATRFTTDLDTAATSDVKTYIESLSATLYQGWEGFTGRVLQREPPSPHGIPRDYVMRPHDVKISYMGKPWCTVPFEVGHNEIGDADEANWQTPGHIARAFTAVGLPVPREVPLMPLTHQVAQKIHALSGNTDRVRDLVDLQIIDSNAEVELEELRDVCERLFAYRKAQVWPPLITAHEDWEVPYVEYASSLPVRQSLQEAVDWVNGLIERIASSS
ncbi:nucleotidyl transferase AbiEii/AbiGii toxin family protein [Boudabousia marimammalium]|uniref:Nucleotidyl transferase AbiEii/AbiGii toxin family protein n=1 Tax=Boudabousia marimammalium TaxID=156892 RepID=A0A1Q5PRU1_9ACTO|nr:nucleotidyl transferase AbiEii/AbiGii toxin family protein [Boudabousia marimammalium]OKL50308.1 hypothetical protein BM477_02670 [Boudabousia marimammalium]